MVRVRPLLVMGLMSALIGTTAPIRSIARAQNTSANRATTDAAQLSVVSQDPYTEPTTFHRTQVEPDTFAFGSTIVSAFQAGRGPVRGASNLGWAASTDRGSTWTEGFLPGTTMQATPPGPWRRATDPSITYDAMHDTWLIFGLESPRHHFVFVSRSTDGAQTFDEPIIVDASDAVNFDKTWIGCDNNPSSPFYGHCYTEWDDEAHHLRLFLSTSTDGGLTWTKATVRHDTRVIDGHPLVQPDGTVLVPIMQCCPTRIDAFISRDGGQSFSGHGTDYSGPLAIRNVRARKARGNLRMNVEPPPLSADMDVLGKVYVTWPDCRFRRSGDRTCLQNDIVMSTTTDGRHWSPVVRVPVDARTSSADHFLPAVGIDPTTSGHSAHIAILYYFYPHARCNRATCALSVGLVSSLDGGSSWDVQQLAGPMKTTWLPLTDSGYMVGDYVGVSFVEGSAIAVFAIATEGTCELGDVTSCNVWTASTTIPLG